MYLPGNLGLNCVAFEAKGHSLPRLFILDKDDDFALSFRMADADKASSSQWQKFLLQELRRFCQSVCTTRMFTGGIRDKAKEQRTNKNQY